MNCQPNVTEPVVESRESIIHFPSGLLGFEKIKRYVLLADPDEAPFAWLQMNEEPKLAFLVIAPMFVSDDYNPEIDDAEAAALGVRTPEDALIFNIVTLHEDGSATVNLKGPIVINRRTLAARQMIPVNAADLPLQHPLNAGQP